MEKTVIVQRIGHIDSEMDIIMPGAIKSPQKVLLLNHFDEKKPIGYVDVFEQGNDIKASGDFPTETGDIYPAIGFKVIDSEVKEDGTRVIKEMKLFCVGLSVNPNADETIKKLKDQ